MSRGNGESAARKPFVIGVAGGTCSGKTTFTERLEEVVGADHLAVIKQDSYYIRRDEQSFEERAAANYDHPDAFDWNLTNAQLRGLIRGETVEVPVYDYPNHNRSDEVFVVRPAPIIVFEGILALYDAELRGLYDLKVFVDTDADLRFIRRLQRDVVARGRTHDSIINQYLTTVRPSHLQFVEPSKRHADVIFPEGGHNDAAFEVLLARVNELIG